MPRRPRTIDSESESGSETDTDLSGFIVSDGSGDESEWSDDDEQEEMDVDEPSDEEAPSDGESEGSVAGEGSGVIDDGLDVNNIIVGKRTRRATQRYVHPNSNLVVEDIPEEEMDAALYDSVGSSEDIHSGSDDDGSDSDY